MKTQKFDLEKLNESFQGYLDFLEFQELEFSYQKGLQEKKILEMYQTANLPYDVILAGEASGRKSFDDALRLAKNGEVLYTTLTKGFYYGDDSLNSNINSKLGDLIKQNVPEAKYKILHIDNTRGLDNMYLSNDKDKQQNIDDCLVNEMFTKPAVKIYGACKPCFSREYDALVKFARILNNKGKFVEIEDYNGSNLLYKGLDLKM